MSDEADEVDVDEMALARKRMMAKGFVGQSEGSQRSKPRQSRANRVRTAVDGRSLRATGRTEQFNFQVRPDVKEAAKQAAAVEGITLVEWMERAIEAAIKGNLQ